mgnify:CR=1 FL=1
MQVLKDNFSCDVSSPTGSATLTIAEGVNSNYTFKWYLGTSASGTIIDSDEQIIKASGMTINEVVAKEGWYKFREIERQVIEQIGEKNGRI